MTFPKPEPRKRTKARQDRQEAAVIAKVRAAVSERDGGCRVATDLNFTVGTCDGPSDLAHLPERRRSKTRGMDPTYRHDRRFCMMLCRKHHTALDTSRLSVQTGQNGADGSVRFWRSRARMGQ